MKKAFARIFLIQRTLAPTAHYEDGHCRTDENRQAQGDEATIIIENIVLFPNLVSTGGVIANIWTPLAVSGPARCWSCRSRIGDSRNGKWRGLCGDRGRYPPKHKSDTSDSNALGQAEPHDQIVPYRALR
jgi:hypothetical protein